MGSPKAALVLALGSPSRSQSAASSEAPTARATAQATPTQSLVPQGGHISPLDTHVGLACFPVNQFYIVTFVSTFSLENQDCYHIFYLEIISDLQQIAGIRRVKTKTNPKTHIAFAQTVLLTCSCILLSLCGQVLFPALCVLWALRLLTFQRGSFPGRSGFSTFLC